MVKGVWNIYESRLYFGRNNGSWFIQIYGLITNYEHFLSSNVWVKSKSAHSPPRATPGHLTRVKSRVGGNLTFVQVPAPRAFDTMKKTPQHLVYPNNMHQYQSRQQCKGLFSIFFCNHMSSVKYRKQEQILKILDTMNRRSQFYNVLKYQ